MRVDREDPRFFDFMNNHKPDDEKRCKEVYEEVKAEFKTDDLNFMTSAVGHLLNMSKGEAYLDAIDVDMWFAVIIAFYPFSEKKRVDFCILCDNINHGVARGYQLVKQYDDGLVAQR